MNNKVVFDMLVENFGVCLSKLQFCWLENLLCVFGCLLLVSTLFGEQIKLENSEILEKFCEALFVRSEGGYVFFGKKPVSIIGYNLEDHFFKENTLHRDAVFIKEGISLLGQIVKMNDDTLIVSYDGEDSLVKNCVHVLVINKPLLIDTIKKNLSLFQYVLGPDFTPEGFFDQISNPKNRFHTILKNDKVLIGIILGFGTQNALYVSRAELIEDALWKEQLPLKSKFSSIQGARKEFLKRLFLKLESEPEKVSIKPSFGHVSLDSELAQLCKKIEICSKKLAQNQPPFMFGRIHEDTEIDVVELEKTQEKILRWNPITCFSDVSTDKTWLPLNKIV